MYVNKSVSVTHSAKVVVNGVRVIRAFDSQSGQYSVNANGHLRSDFAELMAKQDTISMQRALQHMQELQANEVNIPQDATFEDVCKLVRPRWCQSPAELDRFEQYCIDNALDFYKSLKLKTDEETQKAIAAAQAKQDALKAQIKAEMKTSSTE